MMKIIKPLSRKVVTSHGWLLNNAWAIQITFCNHVQRSPEPLLKGFHFFVGQLPKVHSSIIKYHMDSIQPQAIEVVMLKPVQRVARKIFTHSIRPVSIKVDVVTPRG